jgi:hypothetical protein
VDLVGYYGAVGEPDWTRTRFDIRSSHSSSEVIKALYNEGVQQQFGFNSIEAQRNLEAAVAIDPVYFIFLPYLCRVSRWSHKE